jgi:hypothetical protein
MLIHPVHQGRAPDTSRAGQAATGEDFLISAALSDGRAPVNDSWIAATAIAHQVPIVTQGTDYDADAVLYMAGLPLDANVEFLTITATAMPFIGRG